MTHQRSNIGIAEVLRLHDLMRGDDKWCPLCHAENKLSIYDQDGKERVHCHEPDCDLDEDEFGLRKLLGVVPKGAFAMIGNDLLRDPTVSLQARAIYGILVSYAWRDGFTFVGQERLAQDAGKSTRQVRSYLSELIDKKLITSSRRGMNTTNLYRICER